MILSSRGVVTGLPTSGTPLPLGLLTRECDANFNKILKPGSTTDYEINSDLANLFQQFRAYLNGIVDIVAFASTTAPSNVLLYHDIQKRWIKQYVDAGKPLVPTTDLLTTFRESSPWLKDIQFMYVGLYMFVLWYYLVHSAKTVNGRDYLHDKVQAYVTDQCRSWQHVTGIKTVSVLPAFFPSSQFKGSFEVRRPLEWMLHKDHLGALNRPPSLSTYYFSMTGLTRLEQAGAALGFIKCFRSQLASVIRDEYLDLLDMIDRSGGPQSDMRSRMISMVQLAFGDGTTTSGLFNKSNFGTLFWNYELDLDPHETLGIVTSVEVAPMEETERSLWKPDGSSAPRSVFLAEWGAEGPNELRVIPHYDSALVTDLLTNRDLLKFTNTGLTGTSLTGTVPPSPYPESSDRTGSPRAWSYSADTGLLSVHDECVTTLSLKVKTTDEMALLVFTNTLGSPTTVNHPESTVEQRVCFHRKFLDNEFVVAPSDLAALWSSAADMAKTRQIILRLRDNPNSGMKAQVSGGGAGRPTRLPAVGLGSAVESALDQRDNNAPDAENEFKRYGYGEVSWWPKFGLEENLLQLTAEGFASPTRCTWETWQTFQAAVTSPPSAATKAATIFTEIGQYLRESVGPNGLSPSYNTVLSAMRAMGMLEAMVKRLQSRADDLNGSDITNQQCTEIKMELQGYLQGIFVPIKQYLRKGETGFRVGYAPADPLNPEPKTIYFNKYAY